MASQQRHLHQQHSRSAARARRYRPVAGDCPLRQRGSDSRCSGPERISVADGCGTNSRGCVEHAAQALVRLRSGYVAGGGRTDRTALETRMRAAGTWRPRMRRNP